MLLRIIFCLVLLTWLPGMALAFLSELEFCVAHYQIYTMALLGVLSYLPVHYLFVIKRPFVSIFEHELTHMIFAVLFFQRVSGFVATEGRGGVVSYRGRKGFAALVDAFIALAPYVFPTATVILALMAPLLLPYRSAVFFLIGFTFAFHLLTGVAETATAVTDRKFTDATGHHTQSDFYAPGWWYSIVHIPFFLLSFHGLVLAQMRGGYSGSWWFIKIFILLDFQFLEKYTLQLYHFLSHVTF